MPAFKSVAKYMSFEEYEKYIPSLSTKHSN